ncbi:MAG: hypothetical protein MK010_02925 [Erythrobacter sp.]|nr:hypothetical protein [Erythrobacter sp.]
MADDRITETRTTDPQGNTHTTVTHDTRGGGGGGGKIALLLVLVVLIAVGVYFFTQQSGAEIAKDNAVANAAGEVGEAASQVGDAAQDAVGGE